MKRIFLKTFGCSLNQSDSEVMAGLLNQKGFRIVDALDIGRNIYYKQVIVKNKGEKLIGKLVKVKKGEFIE